MVKQFFQLALLMLLLAPSACATTAAQSGPATTAESPSSSSEQTFIEALHQRLSRDKTVPEFGRLEIPPLYIKKPTFAFPENQGTVLQLNIFGFPDAKGTQQLVAPLIGIAAEVADEYEIALSGIEVVFHRRQTHHPMLVWANTPPWEADNIFLTPPN